MQEFIRKIRADILLIVDEAHNSGTNSMKKAFEEYMKLKSMSIREIKTKIYAKGIAVDYIEDYINQNREALEEYELNSAKKIIDKKKRTSDEQKIRGYLLKRGFEPDILAKIEEE